jgi:hypothetical protein
VWSDYGGRGREVTIVHPRRPRWGCKPTRLLPGHDARYTVEGRLIYRRYDEYRDGGEGPSSPDRWWIAVDNGRSDTARAYLVSRQVYSHLEHGDKVRVTVTQRNGYVHDVQVLVDSTGRSIVPIDVPPAAPGAPVPRLDVARLTERSVRLVDCEVHADEVRTWTYHLGDDGLHHYLKVHLTTAGFESLLESMNRSNSRSEAVRGLGDLARRFGDLLVVRSGTHVVGIQRPLLTSFPRGCDEELARIALGRLTGTAGRDAVSS